MSHEKRLTRTEAEAAVDAIRKDIREQHEHTDRSIDLIREMQAQPDADPALEFVLKTLRNSKSCGGIDVFALADRSRRLSDLAVGKKHPYEIQGVDFVNNMSERADVLAGLEGFLDLDYGLAANPIEEGPAEAAKAWIRKVLNWAQCSKGCQEQIESFASSTEESDIAGKIGRGLTTPQVTYDDDVNAIRQCIENVTAAMEQVCEHSYPTGLDFVKECLEKQLVAISTTYSSKLKPVLELKHIAAIMRDWLEVERLESHVKFDMANMVEALDKVIAQHIGEDVPAMVEGEASKESRLVNAFGVLLEASNQHPLDISQDDLKEVALWLNSIMANNPGFHNLGKEGYIMVPRSNNLNEVTIESVKGFLVAYGQGTHMASDLRFQAALVGSKAMANLPEWFATTWGHTSKGGFASLMYHVMTEVASQENPYGVHIGMAKMGQLEEDIRNGREMAIVDYVKEHRK